MAQKRGTPYGAPLTFKLPQILIYTADNLKPRIPHP